MRVVHLGRSTCHAISGRGDESTRIRLASQDHLCMYTGFGFWVERSGFRVWGLGVRVQGLGFRV